MQFRPIDNYQIKSGGGDAHVRDRDLDVNVGGRLCEVVSRDNGHGSRGGWVWVGCGCGNGS